MGATAEEGVVDLQCRVHNYPGLYVVDGTVLPELLQLGGIDGAHGGHW